MSSAIVSNDQPFAAVSSIIWPENKGCYDDNGKEFFILQFSYINGKIL